MRILGTHRKACRVTDKTLETPTFPGIDDALFLSQRCFWFICQAAAPRVVYVLVHIILDRQQIIAHGLKGQLMKDRGTGVEAAVQDQELGASLVRALEGRAGDFHKPLHSAGCRTTHRPPVKGVAGSDLGDKTY